MDENELDDFIGRLRNVADEPKAVRAAASPELARADPEPERRTRAEQTMTRFGAWSARSDESIAYMNALTPIPVVFRDGRKVMTTVHGVDDVIAEEREARRSLPRQRPAAQAEQA